MKTRKAETYGKVYLVGAGPGDAGLLTLQGASLLTEADVIVYDRLVNSDLLEFGPQAEKIYAGKDVRHGKACKNYVDQGKTNALVARLAAQGKRVVRLKGGDPFIFGRGGEEASFLKEKGIPYEVVPGVSAGIAGPAYAGIPVTDRRRASLVTFITAHEGHTKKSAAVRWDRIAKTGGTLVIFMGVKNLRNISKALQKGGLAGRTPVSVIEWATMPHQRVIDGTLETIAEKTFRAGVASPAVTVVGEVGRLRKKLQWFSPHPNPLPARRGEGRERGRPNRLDGKTVLVTRARLQAGTLKRELESRGARVLEFPVIRIMPVKNTAELDAAVACFDDYDWVIFTSTNAVRAVLDRLRTRRKDARAFGRVKIAAIGEATRRALEGFGLTADLMPRKFTSRAILAELRKRGEVRGKRFFLPRTDIAPPMLREELQRGGGKVRETVAYRTLPELRKAGSDRLKELFRKEKVDYITFTSSSTVKHFFDILKNNVIPARFKRESKTQGSPIKAFGDDIKLVSIGPVTTEELRRHGRKPYREAKKHTIEGLIEVLCHDNAH